RAELAQIAFAFHELFVRRDAARAAGHSAQDPDAERNLQDSRDVRRDVVLDLEDVVARTLVRVSPNSAPGAHVDELRADSQTIAGRLQAAAQHVLHAERVADRAQVLVPAFEIER